tara:strand:- start:143 stop:346 length:204 start_codon:yes stop_codon:yes gene_type:complete
VFLLITVGGVQLQHQQQQKKQQQQQQQQQQHQQYRESQKPLLSKYFLSACSSLHADESIEDKKKKVL